MQKRVLALGRMKAGEMNKTEAKYAAYLEAQKIAGRVLSYDFEAVTLKLAKCVRYTPDFHVMAFDGHIEFHEVKGVWRDDAKVKIRTAADKFPMYRFVACYRKRNGWEFEEF